MRPWPHLDDPPLDITYSVLFVKLPVITSELTVCWGVGEVASMRMSVVDPWLPDAREYRTA